MSDRLNDELRRAHELFRRDHDRLRDELMASLPERTSEPTTAGRVRRGWQWIGETNMRRRVFGATAVAALLVLAFLGFWPGNGGHAYGMADVVDLLRNADVIHAKGWIYVPPVVARGQERTRCPLEFWVDVSNARQRARNASYANDGKTTQVILTESVSDGHFSMQINHTERWAEFSRLSPFRKQLQARTTFDGMLKQWFGDPEHLDGFAKVGQERIGAETFDVWQGETDIYPIAKIKMRIKCWIGPRSGEIGKVKYWMQYPGADETWSLVLDIETIERNVPVPPGTFDVDPPAGYTLKNTKETATITELNIAGGLGLGDLTLSKQIEFALEDGSILIGWSSTDTKAEGGQDTLFSGLEFGGALPKLPIELYGLKPMQAGTDVTLVGYHLAHTMKKGRFYEWSLYVADRSVPERRSSVGYQALFRFNPADRKVAGSGQMAVTTDIRIRNRNDFDALVRGAMAELSDNGTAPADVTYDRVTRLCKQHATAPAAGQGHSNE